MVKEVTSVLPSVWFKEELMTSLQETVNELSSEQDRIDSIKNKNKNILES